MFKRIFLMALLGSFFLLSGCTVIKTEFISIPDQYLEECQESLPIALEDYLALHSYRQREILLFKENGQLHLDIKHCNRQLQSARQYQKEALEKLEMKIPL